MAEKALVNGTSALRVITIEASERPQDIKLRVAAYARVNSLSEDQKHSFEAQLRYLHLRQRKLDHGRPLRRRRYYRHLRPKAEGLPIGSSPTAEGGRLTGCCPN